MRKLLLLVFMGLTAFSCQRDENYIEPVQSSQNTLPNPEMVSTQENFIIEIEFLEGDVFNLLDQDETFLEIGDQLQLGDELRVAENSYCVLNFGNYSTITIEENSRLKIDNNSISGTHLNGEVSLLQGSVLCKVQKLTGNDSFQVRTQSGVCGVRGTEFLVSKTEGSEKLKIAVTEGAVLLTPPEVDWESLKDQLDLNSSQGSSLSRQIEQQFPLVQAGQELSLEKNSLEGLGEILSDVNNLSTENPDKLLDQMKDWKQDNPISMTAVSTETKLRMEGLKKEASTTEKDTGEPEVEPELSPKEVIQNDTSSAIVSSVSSIAETGKIEEIITVEAAAENTSLTGVPSELEGMNFFSHENENIAYMGRSYVEGEDLTWNYPGFTITLRFKDSQRIALAINTWGENNPLRPADYFVILDGKEQGRLIIEKDKQIQFLDISPGAGEHVLTLIKNQQVSTEVFKGFLLDRGARILPVEAPGKIIEFIGGSYMSAYGNGLIVTRKQLQDDPNSTRMTSANSDLYHSFALETARHFNSGYRFIAGMGKGISRNWDGNSLTLPIMYFRSIYIDNRTVMDPADERQPDLIVLETGNDDYGVGLDVKSGEYDAFRKRFIKEYSEFLGTLRDLHPRTPIVILYGTQLDDFWPEGYQARTSLEQDMKQILSNREKYGESMLYLQICPSQEEPLGADYHPSLHTHRETADLLIKLIEDNKLL